MNNLTFNQILFALAQNHKVAHRFFEPNEHIKLQEPLTPTSDFSNVKIITEDGHDVDLTEYSTRSVFDDGWFIVNE